MTKFISFKSDNITLIAKVTFENVTFENLCKFIEDNISSYCERFDDFSFEEMIEDVLNSLFEISKWEFISPSKEFVI